MPHDPTPSEKLFMVEAAYGRALLRAHGIELMLSTWLISAATARPGYQTSNPVAPAIKRLTLGGLVRRFVAEASPSAELTVELHQILDLRNRLAHQVSDQLATAALSEEWQERAATELWSMAEQFAACRQRLLPFAEQARAMAGISEEEVTAAIRSQYPSVRIDA